MSGPAIEGEHVAVVIGGGQAGLAMSYCLARSGIEHIVLEKNRIGHDWRERRWDSFCLVTPNWQCNLPGFPYRGPDPYGFMPRDEVVRYIEAYAAHFDPPVLEQVTVRRVRREGASYEIATTAGDCRAANVVLAVGGYHAPAIPRMIERVPPDLPVLHSAEYKNPAALPDGDVLVVGSGQSGCQIAEDLHLAGRRVHLAVGGAPRTARRYRGRDVVEWLDLMGHYRMPIDLHPLRERVREKENHYVTGRDGGRDIDLRSLASDGMRLYGRLIDVRRGAASFAPDLRANLDAADAAAERIKDAIDAFIASNGISAPPEARYVPVWRPAEGPLALDLTGAGIAAVVLGTGFRSDYSWVEVPIFDGRGYPAHRRGVTSADGLFVLGLPWLHTWGSGRFSGIAADAEYLAGQIAARRGLAAMGSNPAARNDGPRDRTP